MSGPLRPYRVLDLSDERGQFAGYLLSSLGAEVILIEPPGGSPARMKGPFVGGIPHPEGSLSFFAANRGKQVLELDLDTADGQDKLIQLVLSADILLESFDPGVLDSKGLGYSQLAERNPGLVVVSVTPFGQDGPKANWHGSDLVVQAAAGPLGITGDPDRPPVRTTEPQTWPFTSAAAAGAALVALYERNRSGRGQHVDCSAQVVMASATGAQILASSVNAPPPQRSGGSINLGKLTMRRVWEALDGYVAVTFSFGALIGPFTARLMEWIYQEGYCDAETRDKDWIAYGMLLESGEETVEEFARVQELVAKFLRTKTKAELFEATMSKHLLVTPVYEIDEVAAFPQFVARQVWADVVQPNYEPPFRSPVSWVRLEETPLEPVSPPIVRNAADIDWSAAARSSALDPGPDECPPERPLSGIRVLDLSWVMAAPAMTRMLAEHGATVVRVESSSRLDGSRGFAPFIDGEAGPERSMNYANVNASKLGITVDLNSEAGRGVIRDLVRWSDVVVESFSPGTMSKWGLAYPDLCELKPDIILLSSSLMGQSGPFSRLGGFGNLASALGGFHVLTGWPDLEPAGPYGAYTDYVVPFFSLVALMAALDYRRRTGVGQYIDFAQAEAALQLLAPTFLNYFVNGEVTQRRGNDDREFAPHGVYRSGGSDDWIAIECLDDAMWLRLCAAMGRSDLSNDPALLMAEGRRLHRQRLDDAITSWMSRKSSAQAEAVLQGQGVSAHRVLVGENLSADPQFLHRCHFVPLKTAELGDHVLEGPRWSLSRTPAVVTPAPTLNEHLYEVLHDLLGYDDDKIAEAVALEVFA